jgi:hypothetical protein
MGKLELEAKDETVGILEEGGDILRRKISRLRQHSGLLVLALFSRVC